MLPEHNARFFVTQRQHINSLGKNNGKSWSWSTTFLDICNLVLIPYTKILRLHIDIISHQLPLLSRIGQSLVICLSYCLIFYQTRYYEVSLFCPRIHLSFFFLMYFPSYLRGKSTRFNYFQPLKQHSNASPYMLLLFPRSNYYESS